MNSKIVIFKLHPFEHKGFEEYLEKQALKGWKLKSAFGFYLKFQRIKPQKLKYSVETLNEVTYFDGENSEPSLNFREYCESAGWEFVCEMEKFQIFCHEGEGEVLPINTEEDIKFKNICKSSLKSLGIAILLAATLSFNAFSGFFIYVNPYSFSSNLSVVMAVIVFLLDIVAIKDVVSFVRFYIKGRKSLSLNERVEYSNLRQIRFKRIIEGSYILTAIFILLFMIVGGGSVEKKMVIVILSFMAIFFIFWKWIGKRDFKRKKKKAIVVAGYVILTVFMFFGIIFAGTSGIGNVLPEEEGEFELKAYERKSESVLASYVFTTDYEILRGKYEWVNKFYFSRVIKENESYGRTMEKVDLESSKDFEVYKFREGKAYLIYSPKMVINYIGYEKELSYEEVIKMVEEELLK